MALTLLQLVDRASGSLGLAQPTSVIGNAQNQTMQLLALANELGGDLVREYEWNRLTKAYIFNTTASLTMTGTLTSGSRVITGLSGDPTVLLFLGNVISGTGILPYAEVLSIDSNSQITMNMPATSSATVTLTFTNQDYALPSDFDRMVPNTNWDRTDHWTNLGSKSSQDWQTLQSGLISTGPRERYRIYGNKFRLFVAPTASLTMSFEYVSTNWVYNPNIIIAAQTIATRSTYADDTDLSVFTDDLMLAGLKYYFLKAKKLDYGVELATFNDILSTRKAQDVPMPALSMSPLEVPLLVGPWSVAEGNWPQA